MCTLSFADGSHCNLNLYTERLFFAKRFNIHTKSKNINPVYVRIFLRAQILRALLSNKNGTLHF